MPPTDASTDTGTESAQAGADSTDTLDLRLPDELIGLLAETDEQAARTGRIGGEESATDDLLDGVAAWGPATTEAGVFQLVP
ncbi:GNAT family N-acetyltransferase, partial [Streptomyces sp. NPDC059002]